MMFLKLRWVKCCEQGVPLIGLPENSFVGLDIPLTSFIVLISDSANMLYTTLDR